jgi:hypothetical protein
MSKMYRKISSRIIKDKEKQHTDSIHNTSIIKALDKTNKAVSDVVLGKARTVNSYN